MTFQQNQLFFQLFCAWFNLSMVTTCGESEIENTSALNYNDYLKHGTYSNPWPVNVLYGMSTVYYLFLYFTDPYHSVVFQWYHAVVLLVVLPAPTWVLFSLLLIVAVTDLRLQTLPDAKLLNSMIKIHHLITLFLIASSYVFGFTSYGTRVMFIHDITDVFMFALRIRRKQVSIVDMSVLCLATCTAVSWIYFRVWGLSSLVLLAVQQYQRSDIGIPWLGCILALIILLGMNTYWTGLLLYKFCKMNDDTDDE